MKINPTQQVNVGGIVLDKLSHRAGKLFYGGGKRIIQIRPEIRKKFKVNILPTNHGRQCFQQFGKFWFRWRNFHLVAEFFQVWGESQIMDKESTEATPKIQGIREKHFSIGKTEKEQPVPPIFFVSGKEFLLQQCTALCLFTVFGVTLKLK